MYNVISAVHDLKFQQTFYFQKFLSTKITRFFLVGTCPFLWGHWYPCFGFLTVSPLIDVNCFISNFNEIKNIITTIKDQSVVDPGFPRVRVNLKGHCVCMWGGEGARWIDSIEISRGSS